MRKRKGVDLDGREIRGGNGKNMGRGAWNQGILYDQNLFSIKEKKE